MISLDLPARVRATSDHDELFRSPPLLPDRPHYVTELLDKSQHYQVYESPHVDQILVDRENYVFRDGDDPVDAFTFHTHPHGIRQWCIDNRIPMFQAPHPDIFWAQPTNDVQRVLWKLRWL
jgi:hypothetical protein